MCVPLEFSKAFLDMTVLKYEKSLLICANCVGFSVQNLSYSTKFWKTQIFGTKTAKS